MVPGGIIFRAKALDYIDIGLMMHTLLPHIYFPGYVAQGFNPTKSNCNNALKTGVRVNALDSAKASLRVPPSRE
jgi:hypothetical protein